MVHLVSRPEQPPTAREAGEAIQETERIRSRLSVALRQRPSSVVGEGEDEVDVAMWNAEDGSDKLTRDEIHELANACCVIAPVLVSSSRGGATHLETGLASEVLTSKAVLLSCMEALHYLDQYLSAGRVSTRVLRGLVDSGVGHHEQSRPSSSRGADEELAVGVLRFTGGGLHGRGTELSSVQQLILYVLNVAHSRGYRRVGTDCYERLYTACGTHDTRSWRLACSIASLVYEVTNKEINTAQWINLTKGRGNAQAVVDYMANCVDSQFPQLVKDRHVFSFRNGIYVASVGLMNKGNVGVGVGAKANRGGDRRENEVIRAVRRQQQIGTSAMRAEAEAAADEHLEDAFLPYGDHDRVLPSRVAACKYFDEDFPEHEYRDREGGGWSSVPTPHLDSIMTFQGFEQDVRYWLYALIGRLIYYLNEIDGWQVMPYLKGQAMTGKSKIVLDVCRNLYELPDVGVLSNNVERKFGIGALSSKFLFAAPEIKSDLQLEQAEFQSMVSGEAVQMAVKFKQAETVDWRVPGIMAGNEVPGWVDNAGSIGRRVILFEFVRKVVDADAELGKKLHAEMPYTILKSNRAYHDAVKRVGTDNVWSHLPEYFKQKKADLTESTNPMQHFMSVGRLEYHPDAYMPLDTMKRAFRSHCDENNFRAMRLTKDMYEPIMVEFGLTLNKDNSTRKYPRNEHGRMMPSREWIVGADVNREAEDTSGRDGGGGNGVFSMLD